MSFTVLVLEGGITHERDVSVRGGNRLAQALRHAGAAVSIAEPNMRLLATLTSEQPDVVWPVLHGASGEDGALREVLELAGVPYVGSRPASCRLAWDKPVAKEIVSRAGVTTPGALAFPRETFSELDVRSVLEALASQRAFPLVVKPTKGGSAQGVTIVHDPSQLPGALVDAYGYADGLLLEDFVAGTEIAVTVLDLDGTTTALPSVEIVPIEGTYSYEARYTAGETDFFVPARLPDDVRERAEQEAVSVHQALGLSGLSRIDFIVSADGTPWFLDANVMPGVTETSLMPLAIRGAGLSEGQVYLQLAAEAAGTATVPPSPVE